MSSLVESGGEVDDFRPTHVVPQEGLPAWEAPDVSRPTAPLDPFLPVQLIARTGEWAQILCSNGWSAWVDGRLLVSVPQPPPTAGGAAPARAEDPRPLLVQSAEALERYQRAAGELASGRVDTDAFRRTVRGLRAGVVVDGESVWLYDESGGRWLYGDGSSLATYAVAEGPGPGSAPPQPPGTDARADSPRGQDPRADSLQAQLDVLPEGTTGSTGRDPTRITDPPG
ncbi:hypothetical protein ACFWUZ_04975 [Streptomyces sp. NPDC058646]|uniref:hypothetical protein n=1 Tax=Streptomyces sp. NPDC058646 TaxID=3346574 RepID=UPI003666A6D9